MTTLQELREAVNAAKEKEIGRHSHHWIEELFCKDCRKSLTKDEIFNMGYNWAISELRAIIDLAKTVLDSKERVEKKECHKHDTHKAGTVMLYPCEACDYNDVWNACADIANASLAKKDIRIKELEQELATLKARKGVDRERIGKVISQFFYRRFLSKASQWSLSDEIMYKQVEPDLAKAICAELNKEEK